MEKIAVFLVQAVLCCASAFASAGVEWLDTTYDFGAFGEDEQVGDAEFKMVNRGTEPVYIVSASATCGCTTPQYSRGEIAPGDTAIITVHYDAEGRPGRFSKSVYVRTSVSSERTRLTIKGIVIGNEASVGKRYPMDMGPLKLRNRAVMMGRVAAGKGKSEFIDGYNQSHSPITPAFANVPKYLQVSASPQTVEPGDMVSFSVYFRGDKCHEWGLVSDSLQICPRGRGGDCYWLPVTAIVEEDFSNMTPEQLSKAPAMSVVGDRIDLGEVPLAATKAVTASIKIANMGKSPLKIRKIYSTDSAVTVKIKTTEIKPGKEAKIEVAYKPGANAGDVINSRLTIITNDPSAPTRTIRIVGTRH